MDLDPGQSAILNELSPDVLRHILSLLDMQSLMAFRQASKGCVDAVDDETLWMKLVAPFKDHIGSPQQWNCCNHRELFQCLLFRHGDLIKAPLLLALHAPFGGLLVCKAEPPVLKLYSLIPYRLNFPPSFNHVWTISTRPPFSHKHPTGPSFDRAEPEQPCSRGQQTCVKCIPDANTNHDAAFAWQPTRFVLGGAEQEPWWTWWLRAGAGMYMPGHLGGTGGNGSLALAVFCCNDIRRCRHVNEDPLRRWAGDLSDADEAKPALCSPLLLPDVSNEVAALQNQFFLLNHVTYLFSNGNSQLSYPGLVQALQFAPEPFPKPSLWGADSSQRHRVLSQTPRLPCDWERSALLYAPIQPANFAGHPLAGIWQGSYGGHGLECVAVFPVPVTLHMAMWVRSGSSDAEGLAAVGATNAAALAAAFGVGGGHANGDAATPGTAVEVNGRGRANGDAATPGTAVGVVGGDHATGDAATPGAAVGVNGGSHADGATGLGCAAAGSRGGGAPGGDEGGPANGCASGSGAAAAVGGAGGGHASGRGSVNAATESGSAGNVVQQPAVAGSEAAEAAMAEAMLATLTASTAATESATAEHAGAGPSGTVEQDQGSDMEEEETEEEEEPASGNNGSKQDLEDLSEALAGNGEPVSTILRGIKLLGDTNVPAGHASFEVVLEEGASSTLHGGVRWELGRPFRLPPGYHSIVDMPSLASTSTSQEPGSPRLGQLIIKRIHKGRGQIAGTGYKQPKWSALDLLEFDLQDPLGIVETTPTAAFGLCWHELSSFSLFSQIQVP